MGIFKGLLTLSTLVGLLAVAEPSVAQAPARLRPAELLRCGEELSRIKYLEQNRELFVIDKMLFTSRSVTFADGRKRPLLIVGHEGGVFAYALAEKGPYWSLKIPNPDPRRLPLNYYLTYTHSEVFGSRLTDSSLHEPPLGRAPLDYRLAPQVELAKGQAEQMILQSLAERVRHLSEATKQGRLGASDLLAGNLSRCRLSSVPSVELALWINRQVRELEVVSLEQPTILRQPANFSGF